MGFEGFLKGKREKKETAEAPKVFSGVEFEPVLDSGGRFVRFKSSSFGRKEIRFEAQDRLPSGRKYDVEVLKDSDPSDPKKGYYEVKIVGTFDAQPFASSEESEGLKQFVMEARYLESKKRELEASFREQVRRGSIGEGSAYKLARSIATLEDRFQEFLSTAPLVQEKKRASEVLKSTIGDYRDYSAFLEEAKERLDAYANPGVYENVRNAPSVNEGTTADEERAVELIDRFRGISSDINTPKTIDPDRGAALAGDLSVWKRNFYDFKVNASGTEQGKTTKELLGITGDISTSLDGLIENLRAKMSEYYKEEFDQKSGRLTGRLLAIQERARGVKSFADAITLQGDLYDLIDAGDVLYSNFVEIRGYIPMPEQQVILERIGKQQSEARAYAQTVEGIRRSLFEEQEKKSEADAATAERASAEQARQEAQEQAERTRIEERNRPKPDSVESLVESAVSEAGEEMGDRHKEVLRKKTLRLKKSPAFQALTSILHDEELARPYNLMLSRKEEMLADQEEDERHRSLAPMFSSLMMHERTKELTELTINESVRERSAYIKEVVAEARKEGSIPYVKEVVIGSGPHSAIYAINRQMVLPDEPSLTLERASVIGGQFAQMGGDLFALNSRTRPERRGQNYLPGTANSLNTFTAYATTQPGDTGGEAYQRQSVLGDHARLNLFLSGEPIVGADVRRIRPRAFSDGYIVEFFDRAKDRILEVETGRVIFTTGVGEEETRLDEDDRTTREILEAEKKKFQEGKDALVLSFSEAASRLADPENPFPLKDFKRIVLSGEGDGGKVLAGVLLGYEGQLAMTATQLDNVEEIVWLGQSYPTKEAFIDNCRARYHQIGLEFPRERFEQYYGRIKPKPEERARRLTRNGDEIRVTTSTGSEYGGDHFIYAHGFRDKTDDIVSPVFSADSYYERLPFDREELNGDVSTYPLIFSFEPALTAENGERTFKGSDLVRIETTPTSTGVEVTRVLRDGSYTVSNPAEFSAETLFKELQERAGGFVNALPVYDFRTSKASVYTADGDASPSARKYDRQSIYRIGPSANLPLTADERRESEALATISENTAAVFRYANKTARLAIELARLDAEDIPRVKQNGLYLELARKEQSAGKAVLPPVPKRGSKTEPQQPQSMRLTHRERAQRIPYAMPNGDLLRLGLGSVLEKYTAPETLSHVEVSVARKEDSEPASYEILIDAKFPDEYRVALRNAFDTELSLTALERFFERKQHHNSVMQISIPFSMGKVDAGKIGFTRSRA